MSDDGFINLRIVDQLFAGNGLSYNAAERVEAATSTLWLLVCSIGKLLSLGFDVPTEVFLMGLSAGLSALAVYTAVPDKSRVPLGMFAYCSLQASWDFVTSGLETPLSLLWLAIVFRSCVSELKGFRLLPAAAWIGLGPLIRPDFGLFSIMGLGILLYRLRAESERPFLRSVVSIGIAALLCPLIYQVFRMGYYAAIIPNTGIAKLGGTNWEQGVIYLRDFTNDYFLWGLVVLVFSLWSLQQSQRMKRVRLLVLLGVGVHTLYVVSVGGDFMQGRMLLPDFFLACCCIPSARFANDRVRVRGGALLCWCMLVALFARPVANPDTGIFNDQRLYFSGDEYRVTLRDYTEYMWLFRDQISAKVEHPTPLWIGPHLKPDRKLVAQFPVDADMVMTVNALGIVGYAASPASHFVDRWGLSSPLAARAKRLSPGVIGHERYLNDGWVLAKYSKPMEGEALTVKEGRRALQCPELVELHNAVSAPLTLDRFLRNIAESVRLTMLKLPSNPDGYECQN